MYARLGDYVNSLNQKKLILKITDNNELSESNEKKFYSYAYASEYYSNFYSGSYQAALEAWKKNCKYWEASGRKLRYYHYSTFGDNYAKTGRYKESIQSFTKSIELYESRKTKNVRTYSELYSKRAKSYYALGEKDNFSLDLEKALDVIDYQEMDKEQFRSYLKNNAFSNYNIELMSSQLTALRDEYESTAIDVRNFKKTEELFERFREGSRFLTSNLTDEFSRFGMLNVISQEFEKHIKFFSRDHSGIIFK